MTIPFLSGAVARFLKLEAAGGIILVAAGALAMVLANSPLAATYAGFLDLPVAVQAGEFAIRKPLLLWINDGLMAVFFLLVGIEIKREVIEGELSSLRQAALPAIGAAGGMMAPALVYTLVNFAHPANLSGWAIPSATDIAFAVGVLALLGTRAPASLKLFLLALAVMDDLGAIVIIALFYTSDLSTTALGLAAIAVTALVALNLSGVRRLGPFMVVGVLLWVCVLKSGVHATLAGVVVGLAIPLKDDGPARELEHRLHPWVAFGILPLFAFANAGVDLAGGSVADLAQPVPLGILLGLFVGKQVGVLLFCWAAIRTGLARMPTGASWSQFYGVAVLTGIGFTMSLFIGTLAFPAEAAQGAGIRLGVLAGSTLSAIAGAIILFLAAPHKEPADVRP